MCSSALPVVKSTRPPMWTGPFVSVSAETLPLTRAVLARSIAFGARCAAQSGDAADGDATAEEPAPPTAMSTPVSTATHAACTRTFTAVRSVERSPVALDSFDRGEVEREVTGHHDTHLRVRLPALALDQETEEAPQERALDEGPLDARRLGLDERAHDRRTHRDELVLGVGQHRLAELRLEVVEPTQRDFVDDLGVVTCDLEVPVPVEEANRRVGKHRLIGLPLLEHQRADARLFDRSSLSQSEVAAGVNCAAPDGSGRERGAPKGAPSHALWGLG